MNLMPPKWMSRHSNWLPPLLLGLWSFACVAPTLLANGPGIVLNTLWQGATRLYSGQSPYIWPAPGADLFHYPPAFATAFGLLTWLPPMTCLFVWVAINSLVFWFGVCRWISWKEEWDWTRVALLVFCAMELDISLRYQQSNALVAGLILLGLNSYQARRFVSASVFLALATHIKVFPFAIGAALALPFHWRFGLYFLVACAIFALVPVPVVGFESAISLHFQQFIAVTLDFSHRAMLDIRPALARAGFPELGQFTQRFILVTGAFLIFISRWISRDPIKWSFWYTLIISTMLLTTPRTESPTFVLLAPAYVLLSTDFKKSQRIALLFLGFFITVVFTSAVSKDFFHFLRANWAAKSFGTFALWGWISFLVARQAWRGRHQFFRPKTYDV